MKICTQQQIWNLMIVTHATKYENLKKVRWQMAATFLPLDAMQAQSVPSCGVRPSVCHVHEFCLKE